MEPQAVLVSMLRLIQEANAIVTRASPGAICIRATGLGQLQAIPQTYQFLFQENAKYAMLTVDVKQDIKTGALTWSPITPFKPIVGVEGNLLRCTVDIYDALKAIRGAGYQSPVFFCSLFQSSGMGVKDPWYCYTPDNCTSLDSSHYIWVNAITGEVRLFPPGEPSLLPSTGSEPAP